METENVLNEQIEKIIEEHLPKIKTIIQDKVAPTALAAVKDDNMMQTLLTPVYKSLPFPVRLVIKKDDFISFCFKHRDKFI